MDVSEDCPECTDTGPHLLESYSGPARSQEIDGQAALLSQLHHGIEEILLPGLMVHLVLLLRKVVKFRKYKAFD
jgi:hypothetical protein